MVTGVDYGVSGIGVLYRMRAAGPGLPGLLLSEASACSQGCVRGRRVCGAGGCVLGGRDRSRGAPLSGASPTRSICVLGMTATCWSSIMWPKPAGTGEAPQVRYPAVGLHRRPLCFVGRRAACGAVCCPWWGCARVLCSGDACLANGGVVASGWMGAGARRGGRGLGVRVVVLDDGGGLWSS